MAGRDSDAYRDLLHDAARGESEPLRAAVSHPGASLERRQFAIGTLGRMRAKEAIPDLIRALSADDDQLLRAEAAAALIWFKDPRVRDALLAALNDQDVSVACEATRGLPRTPDAEVVGRLSDLVLKGRPAVAVYAADALGRIRDDAALPALAGTLERPERGVADAAARALRKFRSPGARQVLRDAKRDRRIRRVIGRVVDGP